MFQTLALILAGSMVGVCIIGLLLQWVNGEFHIGKHDDWE